MTIQIKEYAMEQVQERNFDHKGKTFVLKLFRTDSGFSVVAFLEGHQVSPSYSVTFQTHIDYFMQHKQRLMENLFDIAQSDIEREMYFRG